MMWRGQNQHLTQKTCGKFGNSVPQYVLVAEALSTSAKNSGSFVVLRRFGRRCGALLLMFRH
jgi:hypothetical protein